jgi:hypothetical protein
MAHLLNLNNKKTEFPNDLNEDVDSKQSHQDKDSSGSTITSDSKKVITPEKNVQQKAPTTIPRLRMHSPPGMKIPISPRTLKSPKRNPEEKKQSPEKKEDFIDIEEIKKTFAEEWPDQTTQSLISDGVNKKSDISILPSSEIIKKTRSSIELNSTSSMAPIQEQFIMVRRATISFPRAETLDKLRPSQTTQALVDILVKQVTSTPITKKTVTTVGRQDCAILVLHMPQILMPYVENKSEKYLRSEKLIQSLFSEDIKTGNPWREFKKIYAEIKEKDSLKLYEFGEVEPIKIAAAKSMLKPFSDLIAEAFFGINKQVQNFPLPKEIINFLLASDHAFFKKLLDLNGTSKLSMDDIDKARFSFINNLLVTRLLQPLIVSKLSSPATQLEIWFQSAILNSLQEAIIIFSEDFFDVSFSKAPENLSSTAIKRIKDEEREKKEANLERAKARFSEMRLNSSRRHDRAISEGFKTSDAMEEISKYKLREKALKDRMNKMKETYSMKHLPEALLSLIDSGYKQFMVSHQEINDNQILDYLKKIAISYKENTVLDNDTSMETVDEFIEKLKKAEDFETHNKAIRRATRVTKNFDKGFLKEVFGGDIVPTDTSHTQGATLNSTSSSTSATSSATSQTPAPLPNSVLSSASVSNEMIEVTEISNEKG